MGWTILHFAVEALPLSGTVYAAAWLVAAKTGGPKPVSKRWLHVVAACGVAAVTAFARTAIALLFGGAVMTSLWTNEGLGLIGPLLVPLIASAIGVTLLRRRVDRLAAGNGSWRPTGG